MAKDISRKSVLVLVTVALVVSILSTFFVLNAVYTFEERAPQQDVIYTTGSLSLVVPEPPPESVAAASASITVLETNGG